MNRLIRFVVVSGLVLFVSALPAFADSFNVTLNTSTSTLTGTQALAFEFVDGDGAVNNSVTLSDFSLGGGSTTGGADYLGTTGVSGDLSGTITMNDSGSLALFTQDIDLGSTISFVLATTNNFAGTTPDGFVMELCASDLSSCYSDAADGSLLVLPLSGTGLTPSSFTLTGDSADNLPAPTVTAASGTAPVSEPSSLMLMASGLLTASLFLRRSNARVGRQ